ncbi:MAG: carboxypeptidase-like regulatory domain-containing protein [Acidimicrobiales bacterium]
MAGFAALASAIVLALANNQAASVPSLLAATCTFPSGAGPGFNASIGIRQNGTTVCVTIGEKLLVLLRAPRPNATPWSAIRPARAGVVKIAPLTMMFSRGTTATNFEAIRTGTVGFSSHRPVCSPPATGTATCTSIVLWRITLVVRPRSSALILPSGTGAYGSVTAGPTCPVEQAGNPCPPEPVTAEIDARDAAGRTIASTRTNSAGSYALSLKPGAYTLVVVTRATFPRCPSEPITVSSGSPLRVDVSCDTGIR